MMKQGGIITMGKKSNKLSEEAALYKKLKQLWERGQSDLCEVRGSKIHGRGVYATQDIPAGTKIIEYVGELIDKDESERRAWAQHAASSTWPFSYTALKPAYASACKMPLKLARWPCGCSPLRSGV